MCPSMFMKFSRTDRMNNILMKTKSLYMYISKYIDI